MTLPELAQLASVLVLALLLFFPVSKIIWVLSVRRLQRKQAQPLDAAQTQAQLQRARVIAVLVALVFSYLFHLNVINRLYG